MNFQSYKPPYKSALRGQVFNFLKVTPVEALEIIESLSCQSLNKNPNAHRKEFTTDTGEYFTIAVIEEHLL